MDLRLSSEQEDFQRTIANAADRDFPQLIATAIKAEGRDRGVFPWAASLGLLGMNFPTAFGGAGASKVDSALAAEQLGRADAGLSGMITGQSAVATETIFAHGTEDQRTAILPKVFSGEYVMGIAITEPDTGSNIAGTRTIATPEAGGYRLNGSKIFISYAGIADCIAVIGRILGTEGRDGITMFLVETSNSGYRYEGPIRKLGQHSSDTGSFSLENAWVPAEAVVGDIGEAFLYVQESLTSGRIDYAARSVGVAQACYEQAVKYARVRAPFGTPIVDYQATQFKLARMAMDIEASRMLVYKSAGAYDLDPQSVDTSLAASMAKLHASETVQRAAWEALQIHGAYGYTEDFPISSLYRDARLFTLSEGTSEVQLMLISKQLGVKGIE